MNFPSQFSFSDVIQKSFDFGSLDSLKSFLEDERDFWTNKNAEIQNIRSVSSAHLGSFNQIQSAINAINSWIPDINTWDENSFNQKLHELRRNYLQQVSSSWIWSGHAFINSWLRCYEYSQQTADAFLDVILGRSLNNISSYNVLCGYLFAYEFLNQNESLITKRRLLEKQSFNSVRDQLQKKKTELLDQVSEFQKDINNWKSNIQEEILGWQTEQNKHYDDSALYRSSSFEGRLSSWTQAVADLENKYKEKLRFNGPATYWAKTATKLKYQGYFWVFLLTLISACFIFYLSNFFIAWLQGNATELNLKNIEGVVIFASLVSAFAIMIRAFSRLAFSSFHLQRDAEEREQLTHLYLSLTNESEVDQDTRKIILQALFSRSETGLIGSDSSPTMPGVTEIINATGRGR